MAFEPLAEFAGVEFGGEPDAEAGELDEEVEI